MDAYLGEEREELWLQGRSGDLLVEQGYLDGLRLVFGSLAGIFDVYRFKELLQKVLVKFFAKAFR